MPWTVGVRAVRRVAGQPRTFLIGRATETNIARAVTKPVTRLLGRAQETNVARPMTRPAPGGVVSRFRSGSWLEKPLPANAPIHVRNTDYLLELNGEYNGVETDGTFAAGPVFNGRKYLMFTGGVDQQSATSFDTPIYRVTPIDTSYTVTKLTGAFYVPNRFLSVADGGTGEGVRIPELAKAHFLLGGAQSSDQPMCIYDAQRGYYANFGKILWNSSLSRWEIGLNGGGSIYRTPSYGLDSNNTNDITSTAPAEWPAALHYYQDEFGHENHGAGRGNNPMVRMIDYDRLVAEQKLSYVTEMYAVRTFASNVFPMVGFESGKGGLIPEGVRCRIKPAIDVRARLAADGLTGTRLDQAAWIAKGLQDYGCYVGDNSGSGCRVKLEALQREDRPYLWQVNGTDLRTFGFGTTGDWEFIADNFDPGGDTQAPSIPTGLVQVNASPNSVGVAWTASTDNVGVTLYQLDRDGVNIGVVGPTANTGTNIPGLAPSTSYAIKIQARDAADNRSAFSTPLTVTTTAAAGDTTPPTIPTNLAASGITQSAVTLTWSASTDAVGVTGYEVQQNGAVVRTVTATTTQITGLSAGTTYSFAVSAFDAAGNDSGFSTAVSVTTQTPVGTVTTVAMAGDTCAPTLNASSYRHIQTSDLIFNDSDIDVVLALGDNQYESGTLAQHNASYNPSWGRFKAKTFPIPGNHEYFSSNIGANYGAYWGSKAQPRGSGLYSYTFDLGGWHFLMLDSDIQHRGASGASAQLTWMDGVLAGWVNDGIPIICAMHHNRFSNGGTGSHGADATLGAFYTRLYTAKCDLVVHGHNHYADFSPRVNASGQANALGFRILCVGTGGHPSDGIGTQNIPIDFREASRGVLKLYLSAHSYEYKYFNDSGTQRFAVPPTPTHK